MKNKKHILVVLLAALMLLGNISPAVLAETQTYAYDTMFQAGKNLTVAYLGGSITEGAGGGTRWSTLLTSDFFNDAFKTEYGTGTATEVNAGIGGTPSDLGLFRLANDVSYSNPDIVFVEFAVNDSGTATTEAGALQVRQRMEGIVRQLQKLPKQPVVIFIYTAAWKEDTQFNLPLNCAKLHEEVASYYGIGSINLCEYVAGGTDLDGQPIVWNKDAADSWTGDNTHPNAKGYQKYAQYIEKQLNDHPEKYFKRLTEKELPKFGYEFGSPALVAGTNTDRATYSSGDWQPGGSTWAFRGTTDKLMYTTNAGATASFTFSGRSIGLYVLRGDRGNSATYTVKNDEGATVKSGTVNNFYRHATSYNSSNPKGTTMAVNTLLINELPYDDYTLELTTNAITVDTNGYTKDLFAIGYYMVDEVAPAVQAPEYVQPTLQISETDTSLSRANKENPETAYVQAKLTDTFGTTVLNSNTVHTPGVTYQSSNQEVLTIDENGLMTPVQEGTSFVTATYQGTTSQKLMVIVYSNVGSINKTWDSDALGLNTTVLASVHDNTLKFKNSYEIISGGHESDATGRSVHYFKLDKATMGNDEYARTGDWKSGTNYIAQQLTGVGSASDQSSVLEMWFYDDGKTEGAQFWLAGITVPGVSDAATLGKPQDLRHTFRATGQYYNMSRNSLVGTWASKEAYYQAAANQKAIIAATPTANVTMAWAPSMTLYSNAARRSKGWHQFVWDATADYVTNLYVDGILIGQIDTTALGIDFVAHQVPSVRFDRMFTKNTTPQDQEMTIDNITLYETKSTGIVISDLTVHHNKTSYALGETGKLTARGAEGSLTDLPADQVIFSTMDDTIISLQEDGTLSAIGVGVAKVTAKANGISKIINVVVHQPQTVKQINFDDMGSTLIDNCYSAQNNQRWISNSYEFTSAKTRTGSGLSLHLKNINVNEMGNDTFKTYLSALISAGTNEVNYMGYTLPNINSGNESERGVAEVWFYDFKEANSVQQIYASGYRTTASNAKNLDSMRVMVNFASDYYTLSDGYIAAEYPTFTKYNLPRTKGWHQLLIDYSIEDTYTLYIDGKMLGTRTAEGWNGGLSAVRIDRHVRSGDMTALTDVLPLQMTIDDCSVYSIDRGTTPTLAETEISAIDVTKSVTYYAQGTTGQIQVKAISKDGSKFDATGDSEISYTVSDPAVLTVGADGQIQPNQVGYALVTITAMGANNSTASKKLLITVGNSAQTVSIDANNDQPLKAASASYEYATDIYRTGVHSYHMLTNHIWSDIPRYKNTNTYYSFVFSGWLYDEGIGSSSTPTFAVISENPGGKNNMNLTYGIAGTEDAYYRLNNNAASRATWAPGAKAGNLGATGQYQGNPFTNLLNGTNQAATNTFTNPVTGTQTTYPGSISVAAPRTKGWHQFAIVVDAGGTTPENLSTANGKMEFYIDGELVMTDRYVPTYAHGVWLEKTGYVSDYQFTHYAVERKAPVASNVSVGATGNLITGSAYTATANVTDPNGYNQELKTVYGWETSDSGIDGWASASSAAAYTAPAAGKYVRSFAQATGAVDGLQGEKVYSEVKQVGVTNPKITLAIAGSGSVKDENQATFQNGAVINTTNGDNVSLSLVPEVGYELTSIKAGSVDLIPSNNEVVLENMNLDTTLTIVFTEKAKEKPGLSSSGSVLTQNNYKPNPLAQPGFSAMMHSQVNVGYGYEVLEAGMKVTNQDGSIILLPVVGTWSDTNQYGVRIFGVGITNGTYQMTPYVKVKDNETSEEEVIYGESKDFTKVEE